MAKLTSTETLDPEPKFVFTGYQPSCDVQSDSHPIEGSIRVRKLKGKKWTTYGSLNWPRQVVQINKSSQCRESRQNRSLSQ